MFNVVIVNLNIQFFFFLLKRKRRVMNYDFVIFYDGGEADDITVLET